MNAILYNLIIIIMKDTNWRISKDSSILVEKESFIGLFGKLIERNFHNTVSLYLFLWYRNRERKPVFAIALRA